MVSVGTPCDAKVAWHKSKSRKRITYRKALGLPLSTLIFAITNVVSCFRIKDKPQHTAAEDTPSYCSA